MALLTGTQQNYYEGDDYGSYQFTSIRDIIDQFMVAYVGEGKTISKVNRTDVAFHAQRALQELSFDTFKSIKSQEIVLPPTLTMRLPHDYVNYTKLTWSDSAGIEHIIYPTSKTSNPFKIKQNDDGEYDFVATSGVISSDDLSNVDFSSALSPTYDWIFTPAVDNTPWDGSSNDQVAVGTVASGSAFVGTESTTKLIIDSKSFTSSYNSVVTGRAYAVWQPITVTNMDTLDIRGFGTSADDSAAGTSGSHLRIGISSTPGDSATNLEKANPSLNDTDSNPGDSNAPNFLTAPIGSGTNGLAYVEWFNGDNDGELEVLDVDVSGYNTVYVLITCWTDFSSLTTSVRRCTLTDIEVTYEGASPNLVRDGDSTTWTNYKSATPSENQDDYQDDTYWLWNNERYGIDPQHAQVNGSFFIDNLKGLVHFSSNISGKTVVLDYISDSLGTWQEMKVHKFAEEAMYKWIMYAILSTRANTPEHIVQRYKKEKFAATRQAKLRLSNVKLEELTQILRGKSKHIKH